MGKFVFLLTVILFINNQFSSGQSFTDLNSKVNSGQVNYEYFQNSEHFEKFVGELKNTNTAALSGNEAKAFWINVYNATVILNVNKYYPISSIDELQGGGILIGRLVSRNFFRDAFIEIADERFTLLQISNRILPEFNDPRVAFVLLHPMKGGFNIDEIFFTANDLDEKLTSYTKLAINSRHHTAPDLIAKNLHLSELFEHYHKIMPQNNRDYIRFILFHLGGNWLNEMWQSELINTTTITNPEQILIRSEQWNIRYREVDRTLNVL